MKYYDRENDRIVFIQKSATDKFWDELWQKENIKNSAKQKNRFIKNLAKKYLNKGNKVIDGGCGNGNVVYTLNNAGYDAYGADFAKKTVSILNTILPELKIIYSDVRSLNFEDNFFNGYFSLGVIEHFKDGYIDIIREANRVLKKNGYLFLSFPHISFIRRLKIILNIYPFFNNDYKNFYQFAFNKKHVINILRENNFTLKKIIRYDAFKGLKDEVKILNSILNTFGKSKNIISRLIIFAIKIKFKYISSHICMLVLKKEK